MELNEVYSVNTDYLLRHDRHRSFITSREDIRNNGTPGWISMIHPEQAKIFSFFTHGITLENSIKELSNYIGFSFEETRDLIAPYIENENEFYTSYSGNTFEFPRKLIIRGPNTYKSLSISDFDYETLDFETKRMYTGPVNITLMLSNNCFTNCMYCYADTKHKMVSQLSLQKVTDIIKQAYELDVNNFSLIGGEIFAYKYWKEVLVEIRKYGFYPDMISTKKPVTEGEVLFLKNAGIKKIQLSFDSIDDFILSKLLGTPASYKRQITDSLAMITKYGLTVQIAITLTKINSGINNLEKLLNFLSGYPSVTSVDIGPAFYSLYKEINFYDWGISKKEFDHISTYIHTIKNKYTFKINVDESYTKRGFYTGLKGSAEFPGASCSANRDHIFILPDGQVTICEQLYWNKNFIVGDITKNNIVEIWNSPKSNFFANLRREHFSNCSICKLCKLFEKCHKNVNKCWADIIKAYGNENWDFPDPRCAFAPLMLNNISF